MICLHGGNYTNEGRVEVYCNEQWGTICDDGFSSTDAQTICKQLGYNYYNRYYHLSLLVLIIKIIIYEVCIKLFIYFNKIVFLVYETI